MVESPSFPGDLGVPSPTWSPTEIPPFYFSLSLSLSLSLSPPPPSIIDKSSEEEDVSKGSDIKRKLSRLLPREREGKKDDDDNTSRVPFCMTCARVSSSNTRRRRDEKESQKI